MSVRSTIGGSIGSSNSVIEPVLLSLAAGMATGIGGIIALTLRKIGGRVISFPMGLASGIILLIAFNNIFLEAETTYTYRFDAHVFVWRPDDDGARSSSSPHRTCKQ
jgi:zinc transporter ZupT